MLGKRSLSFMGALLWLVALSTGIRAAPSGSGRIAFISDRSGRPQIYVMNADGSNITSLIDPPGRINESFTTKLAFSPDGRKVAFIADKSDQCCQLYVVDIDGSSVTRMTKTTGEYRYPAFSPDGQRIAFATVYGLYYEQIFMMNLDGSNLTRLTNLRGGSFYPSFSPDGRKIAFISGKNYFFWGIYVMNVDGSGVTRLTDPPGISIYPEFSPEGKIAFVSNRKNSKETWQGFQIYIMNADGSNPTPLTSTFVGGKVPGGGTPLSFSLDGRKIAFNCERSICVMNADGSNLIVLTDGRAPAFIP